MVARPHWPAAALRRPASSWLTLFENDLAGGILARLEVDYEEVFETALDISFKFGQTLPIKTADLFHVAMMKFGFDHFVTADKQQHDFAVGIGVTAVFLPP